LADQMLEEALEAFVRRVVGALREAERD